VPRSKCAFTQADAIRALKAVQKAGIPLGQAKVTINTPGGGSIVIDFQNMNGDIGKNGSHGSEWDVPPAGVEGARSR
jgi:hypothetical protein